MALNRRWVFGLAAVFCICFFFIGLVIGHFAIKPASDGKSSSEAATGRNSPCATTFYSGHWEQYKNSFMSHCESRTCFQHDCHKEGLPRTYLAYHLKGKTINIDGRLDDEAWTDVPWTDNFMDIRGPDYPKPYFDTKVKVRWDDTRLYVGALMQETHFWGTFTQDESFVWQENAFEVYAVPDGSLHNYKEMQISVRNVTWDLMLRKAYIDREECTPTSDVVVSNWTSNMEKATYTDGIINDPNGNGTYWSAEWSFSFENLAQFTERPQGQARPADQEAWFFIFARPQYQYKIVNGQYQKDESKPTEWWSWQPMYTVNLHLPSRFGLVQFKESMEDKTFHYEKWHIYRALFEVFDAMHRYKSTNGMFIDELKKLDVAPKVMSTKCVDVTANVNGSDFHVTAKSRINISLPTGNIRADRYVWFT